MKSEEKLIVKGRKKMAFFKKLINILSGEATSATAPEKKEFQRKTEEKQNTPININRASTSQNSVNTSDFIAANPDDIQEGMRVLHQKFGQGEVLKVEGIGPNKKATVLFDECGSKQLMLKFAKLNILK